MNGNAVPVVTPAVYASGTGTTSRSRWLSTMRTIGVAAPGHRRADQRARMHVALGHDAVERRRDSGGTPSMSLIELSACRAASTFCCAAAIWLWIGFDGLLRQDDVVAGDDTRRGGRGLQLVVRARVGVGLRADGAELRLRALQLRLRLGSLRDEFRRLERRRACSPARTREPRSTRIVFTKPVTRDRARRSGRASSSPGSDSVTSSGCSTTLHDLDGRRPGRRGLLGRRRRRVAAARRPAPATARRRTTRAHASSDTCLMPLPAHDTRSPDRRDPARATPRRADCCTSEYTDGSTISVAIVAAARPPITARPSGAVASAPSPKRERHGNHAGDHRGAGHQHRPHARARGVDGGVAAPTSRAGAPAPRTSPAESRSRPRRRWP